MKKISFIIIFQLFLCCAFIDIASAKEKGKKAVHVSSFQTIGFPEIEGREVARKVSKSYIDTGKFFIVTQAALEQGLAQQEKQQVFGCEGDKCMKALMQSSKVDYIVYGKLVLREGYNYITIKKLDKTAGAVKLSNIKTVRFKDKKYMDEAVNVLTEYSISGKEGDVQDFQDRMNRDEKLTEKRRLEGELDQSEEKKEKEFKNMVEQYKVNRKRSIADKKTYMRTGYSSWGMRTKDDEFNSYYYRGKQYMFDFMIPLNPQPFDIYYRFTYKTFKMKDVDVPAYTDPFYETIVAGDQSFIIYDVGFRYRMGMYFLMTQFDLFMLGGFRLNFEGDYGYIFGVGAEIAFFENVGFFGEFNYGSLEVGENNVDIEDNQMIFGLTFRF